MAARYRLGARMHCTVLVVLMSCGIVSTVPRALIKTPLFPPDVLVNMLATDGDAELSSNEVIHVERRFAVYMEN